MISYNLVHPELLGVLARSGHGSKILIADGNFPHATGAASSAARISLNVRPGLLTVDQILEVLVEATVFESAAVMAPPGGQEPDAVRGYRDILGPGVDVTAYQRSDFYDQAKQPDVAALIASADLRHYANLLLTVGVRPAA
ncbi:MAG: RbsD or FucU transport [Sinomonas sp.]|jgi:L-fucose mutarotase|nr:RbsD or FucU transport [Sinomonas sp.]